MSYADDRNSGGNTVLIVLSIIGVILVVVLVACAGIGYLVYRGMQPMVEKMQTFGQDMEHSIKLAQQFLKDLRDNEVAAAYELTSKDFHKRYTLAEFEKLVRQHPDIRQSGPIERGRLQPEMGEFRGFDATIREFVYRYRTEDGKEAFARIKLTKEDDSLKIDDVMLESWGSHERNRERGTARSSGRKTEKKTTGRKKGDDDDDDDGG